MPSPTVATRSGKAQVKGAGFSDMNNLSLDPCEGDKLTDGSTLTERDAP